MTSLWLDIGWCLLLSLATHSLAFAAGAYWHHEHFDIEQAKAAAGTEGRP
jgi:hypothetical protein